MIPGDPVRFVLVYDAAAAGYTDWWFPAAGCLMLAIFSIALYRHRRSETPSRAGWIYYFGVPFIAMWVVVAFTGTYRQYATLRDRLRDGRFTTVTGTVKDFEPSDAGDHLPERWAVESGGHLYRYSYVRSNLSPGFRQTAIHGGPIRNGLVVRVADIDGNIARLEVAE